MERQVATLEADVQHVRSDISEMKSDIRDLRKDFGAMETKASSRHEELKDAIGALRLSMNSNHYTMKICTILFSIAIVGAVLEVLARALKWI